VGGHHSRRVGSASWVRGTSTLPRVLGLRLERKRLTNQRQYTLTKCVQAISALASSWGIQRRLVPSHARHGYQLVLKNTLCHQYQQVATDQQVVRAAGQSWVGGSRGERSKQGSAPERQKGGVGMRGASAIHNNRHLRPSCKPSAHMSASAANGNRSADGEGCTAEQGGRERRRKRTAGAQLTKEGHAGKKSSRSSRRGRVEPGECERAERGGC